MSQTDFTDEEKALFKRLLDEYIKEDRKRISWNGKRKFISWNVPVEWFPTLKRISTLKSARQASADTWGCYDGSGQRECIDLKEYAQKIDPKAIRVYYEAYYNPFFYFWVFGEPIKFRFYVMFQI